MIEYLIYLSFTKCKHEHSNAKAGEAATLFGNNKHMWCSSCTLINATATCRCETRHVTGPLHKIYFCNRESGRSHTELVTIIIGHAYVPPTLVGNKRCRVVARVDCPLPPDSTLTPVKDFFEKSYPSPTSFISFNSILRFRERGGVQNPLVLCVQKTAASWFDNHSAQELVLPQKEMKFLGHTIAQAHSGDTTLSQPPNQGGY